MTGCDTPRRIKDDGWSNLLEFNVGGVRVESRHGIKRELERVVSALFFVPWQMREHIVSIFCNSKHGTYSITIREAVALAEPEKITAADFPRRVAGRFEAGLRSAGCTGHSGIEVMLADRQRYTDHPLVELPGEWWSVSDPGT